MSTSLANACWIAFTNVEVSLSPFMDPHSSYLCLELPKWLSAVNQTTVFNGANITRRGCDPYSSGSSFSGSGVGDLVAEALATQAGGPNFGFSDFT